MLAAVAAEIIVADGLPAAAEYTWFQKFSLVSMLFAFISLIESVVSISRMWFVCIFLFALISLSFIFLGCAVLLL